MAFGLALEREAPRPRCVERQSGGGEFACAEAHRGQRKASHTRRRSHHIGELRDELDAAGPEARGSGSGGKPRSGQRQIERLTAAILELAAEVEAAAKRSPGELGPAREIGHAPVDRTLGQISIESDAQTALDYAVRNCQPEARQDQFGIALRPRYQV
jgi:hypothetical protein